MGGRLLCVLLAVLFVASCNMDQGKKPADQGNSVQQGGKGVKPDTSAPVLPTKKANGDWDMPRQAYDKDFPSMSLKKKMGTVYGVDKFKFEKAVFQSTTPGPSEPQEATPVKGAPMPDFTDYGVNSLIECWRLSGDVSKVVTVLKPKLLEFFASVMPTGSCGTGPYVGDLFAPDPAFCSDGPVMWMVTPNQKVTFRWTNPSVQNMFLAALQSYADAAVTDPALRCSISGLNFGGVTCSPYRSVITSTSGGIFTITLSSFPPPPGP